MTNGEIRMTNQILNSNFQIPNCKSEIANRKFEVPLSAEQIARIDAKHLVTGKPPRIDAELVRAESGGPKARHYVVQIRNLQSAIRIQLNHGDELDDASRLADVTVSLLTKPPLEEPQTDEPVTLHRS